MSSVSIVGIRGAGKTTSLGLLHEGLTALANRDKNFQFVADLAAAGYLYDIVARLRRGDWPEITKGGTQEEVKFKLRFKKPIGWRDVEIDSYDISGEDIERTLESMRTARNVQQIIADLRDRKALAAILNSDVFVFVVDSMVCDPTHSRESEAKKADHDLHLGHLCLALQEYKSRTRGSIKALGIIFAKYDIAETWLPLGKVDYYSMEREGLFVETGKTTEKNLKAFQDVVREYLPTTYNNLSYALRNVAAKNLRYFRSGITMKQDEQSGKMEMVLPLEFTAGEYVNIAKWLSDI
ncbi:MAG: hypothetical protein V1894_00780 [Chloroflexota bacterium]